MIVYQAATSFFPMKADAEAHAKLKGLKASSVNKLSINDREELAELLNKITGIIEASDTELEGLKAALDEVEDDPDDFIPAFVRADWERRRKARGV